jgi:hypothetical protein
MDEVSAMAGGSEKAIDHFFGSGDFEAGAEGATGINERDEVLRVTLDGAFEEIERFVETICAPKRAGLLEFGKIDAEAWYDLRLRWHGVAVRSSGFSLQGFR